MLPDFPMIKERFEKVINRYLQRLVRQESLLSQIREERHFEGNRTSCNTEDGEIDVSSYREFSGQIEVKKEEIIAKGPMALIEKVQVVAEELKKQKAQYLFEKLNQVTERAGTQVNAKGQPFTFDHFLAGLEKIWIDFDESGNPHMPTVVVNPVLGAKLKDKLPEWEANPENKKRFDALIEKKRKEWNDREGNRKLVN